MQPEGERKYYYYKQPDLFALPKGPDKSGDYVKAFGIQCVYDCLHTQHTQDFVFIEGHIELLLKGHHQVHVAQ